jgi:hypothetical protein
VHARGGQLELRQVRPNGLAVWIELPLAEDQQ